MFSVECGLKLEKAGATAWNMTTVLAVSLASVGTVISILSLRVSLVLMPSMIWT